MMIYNLTLFDTLLCFAVGLGVGGVYFGGLWWTVQHLKSTKSVAKTMFLSMFFRNVFMCVSLYFAMQNDWHRLLVCFAGMMVVRFSMIFFMKTKNKQEKVKE